MPEATELSAPLGPPFLTALGERTGRRAHGVDMLAIVPCLPGSPPAGAGPALKETEDRDHLRTVRALRYRDEVRAWTVPGGTVLIGRGVAGRWEVALEVEPPARGTGLGRFLARAARHLVPDGEPLWAQVAPGNAASVRPCWPLASSRWARRRCWSPSPPDPRAGGAFTGGIRQEAAHGRDRRQVPQYVAPRDTH